MIPAVSKYIWPLKNKLVNRERNVQDERGIKYVAINSTNYQSDEPLVLYVLQEHMIWDRWWWHFVYWQLGMTVLYFIHQVIATEHHAGRNLSDIRRKATFLWNLGKRTARILKDFNYWNQFVHTGPFFQSLLLTMLLAPYYILYLLS